LAPIAYSELALPRELGQQSNGNRLVAQTPLSALIDRKG
jgi:hypothetical protein